jgi:hypothetical protein
VNLESRAVELPLDRRRPDASEGVVEVFARLRQHRLDRAEHREPEARETVSPVRDRRRRDRPELAGQHHRAADLRGRDRGRLRDRFDHHALERALSELAEEEPDQESLL